MRQLSIIIALAVLAGCGDGGSSAGTVAPAVTPASEPESPVAAQAAAEARALAERLGLDAATEAKVAAALVRAWADVERDALDLSLGERDAGESLDEAIHDAIERRQVEVDHEIAALLDPEQRARFAEQGGRLEEVQ